MAKSADEKVEQIEYSIAGRSLPVTVKRRARQKYIRLRISGRGELLVSAPKRTSGTEIRRALSGKSGWIATQMKRIEEGLERIDPHKRLYYAGSPYTVKIEKTGSNRRSVRLCEREAVVRVALPESDEGGLEEALSGWLKRRASQELRSLAEEISEEIDLPFKRLYIRNQRSRWGSSSSIGNISINWRVVMAPPQVQRYLIIHELAHQRHLNHSAAFWAEVARLCPEYRRHESWLKEHREFMALFRF